MSSNQSSYNLHTSLVYRARRHSTMSSIFLEEEYSGCLSSTATSALPTESTAATSHTGDPLDANESLSHYQYGYISEEATPAGPYPIYPTLTMLNQSVQDFTEPSDGYVSRNIGDVTAHYRGHSEMASPEMMSADQLGEIGLVGSMEALPGSTPSSRRSTTCDVAVFPDAVGRVGWVAADEAVARHDKTKRKKKSKSQKSSDTSRHTSLGDGNTYEMGATPLGHQTFHNVHRLNAPNGARTGHTTLGPTQEQLYHYPQCIAENDLYGLEDEHDWVVIDSNVAHY